MSSDKAGNFYKKERLGEDTPQPYGKKRAETHGLSASSRWSPTRDISQSGQSSGAKPVRDNAGTSGKPDLSRLTPVAKEVYEGHAKQLAELNEKKVKLQREQSKKEGNLKDAKHSQRINRPKLQDQKTDIAKKLEEVNGDIKTIEKLLKEFFNK